MGESFSKRYLYEGGDLASEAAILNMTNIYTFDLDEYGYEGSPYHFIKPTADTSIYRCWGQGTVDLRYSQKSAGIPFVSKSSARLPVCNPNNATYSSSAKLVSFCPFVASGVQWNAYESVSKSYRINFIPSSSPPTCSVYCQIDGTSIRVKDSEGVWLFLQAAGGGGGGSDSTAKILNICYYQPGGGGGGSGASALVYLNCKRLQEEYGDKAKFWINIGPRGVTGAYKTGDYDAGTGTDGGDLTLTCEWETQSGGTETKTLLTLGGGKGGGKGIFDKETAAGGAGGSVSYDNLYGDYYCVLNCWDGAAGGDGKKGTDSSAKGNYGNSIDKYGKTDTTTIWANRKDFFAKRAMTLGSSECQCGVGSTYQRSADVWTLDKTELWYYSFSGGGGGAVCCPVKGSSGTVSDGSDGAPLGFGGTGAAYDDKHQGTAPGYGGFYILEGGLDAVLDEASKEYAYAPSITGRAYSDSGYFLIANNNGFDTVLHYATSTGIVKDSCIGAGCVEETDILGTGSTISAYFTNGYNKSRVATAELTDTEETTS